MIRPQWGILPLAGLAEVGWAAGLKHAETPTDWMLTVVLAIFGLVIAAVFKQYPAAIFPCVVQIPIAVAIGVLLHGKGRAGSTHLRTPARREWQDFLDGLKSCELL